MFNLIRFSTHFLCVVLVTLLGYMAHSYITEGFGIHPAIALTLGVLAAGLMLGIETLAHLSEIDMDQLTPPDLELTTTFNHRS